MGTGTGRSGWHSPTRDLCGALGGAPLHPPMVLGVGLALATLAGLGDRGCHSLLVTPPASLSSASHTRVKYLQVTDLSTWQAHAELRGSRGGHLGCLLSTVWGGRRDGARGSPAQHHPRGSVHPSTPIACWIRPTSEYLPNLNAMQTS